MKKLLLITIIAISLIACKNEKKTGLTENKNAGEKLINTVKAIFSEKVYEIDSNGNKKNLVFIIEGKNLYEAKNGKKHKLFLEKKGNIVYECKNGKITDKPIFIFEDNKYWEINNKTKGRLVFERKKNIIYEVNGTKLKKMFIVE